MTQGGIPAWRRHVYFVTSLFLLTAAVNQSWDGLAAPTVNLDDYADAQELRRLQDMAETAQFLYQ